MSETNESKVVVMLTTTVNETEASRISRALVEEGLAACVQRASISSVYVWDGRVEEGAEYLLIIKTLAECSGDVDARIHALSSYAVPEVVALEATSVGAAYEAWLRSACCRRPSY